VAKPCTLLGVAGIEFRPTFIFQSANPGLRSPPLYLVGYFEASMGSLRRGSHDGGYGVRRISISRRRIALRR
jgi:hypothetical protein